MNSQRVIIAHLRRTNPTKHLSTSTKEKLNCGQKVWDELCHYKTFLRVDWEGVFVNAESRDIPGTINTFQSLFFFSKLTLNSTTVQLRFTTDFQKKVVVSIISFTSKDCVPHNKYAYSSDSSSRRIKQEIQLADVFFLDKYKLISRLFKMLKSRNFNIRLISSSFL